MADLKNILAYILKQYPNPSDLSNARVTKMVYLADWHQAIHYNKQLSTVQWYFDNYGPFVWDVFETVQKNTGLFSWVDVRNFFGKRKIQFSLGNNSYQPVLTDEEKLSLQHVIDQTSKLGWNDFIKLVYSTYPILSSERYSYLNLPEKAREYALT